MLKPDKGKIVEVNDILIPEGWMIINVKNMEDFIRLSKNYTEILQKDDLYYLLNEANIIFVHRE